MFYQANLTSTLMSIPWFHELDMPRLERLAKISDLCEVDPNVDIFQEGEREDYLYVVIEGQVAIEIFVPGHGRMRIYTAEPLDIFGWSSLTPVVRQRTATARALTETRLLSIESESLRRLCDEDEHIGYLIMRRISNIVASRLLTTRLTLMDLLANPGFQKDHLKSYSE